MKILLTGATGFMGRNLQEAWKDKHLLFAPSRSELDLLDSESVEQYLTDGNFDVIVHAANTNHVVHPDLSEKILDYNLRMFSNLQKCSKLYKRLLYFGSGAEYSSLHYIPHMKEDYLGKYVPRDSYGFSKYLMSIIAQKSPNIYELCLFGVFGKYEEWSRRFISNSIYQCMTGHEIHMEQHMYLDYIYIDDLIKIIDWFLINDPKFHRYNVCTGEGYDLYVLAQMVRDMIDCNAPIILKREGWKVPYIGDNTRLRHEMGSLHFTPISKSIEDLIQYYKRNGFV